MTKLRLDWKCGFSNNKFEEPSNYFEATVPGSVQLDYAKKYHLGDYNKSNNYLQYQGLEDYYWTYKAVVPKGQNRYLISNGIDYQYEIYFDNQLIYQYEGMYQGFKLLLPNSDLDSTLKIVIFPAPKAEGESGRSQVREAFKTAVSYGWDFQARLIPLGIWNDCWIEQYENHTILNQEISYELSDDLSKCYVHLNYVTTGGEMHWFFNDILLTSKATSGELNIVIDNPKLWYPIGYGEQFLYESKTWIDNTDVRTNRIGFRRVRMIPRPSNWEHESYEGCTQALPPITLEVNHIQVFAKGSNFVIPDVFYSKMNQTIYAHYINLAKNANFNILRCWGGCMVNKDEFYQLCDETGIMVIQEFPLSCNNYPDKPRYLNVLKTEAKAIVKNLRHFASVITYSGGNELFEGWSMMTEQSKALRLLNSICLELDENTPFLMSLPIYGVIHGSYGFKYRENEPQLLFRQMKATAYTEFGVPSLSSKACFNQYMPNPDENIETHFGVKAWPSNVESWSCKTQLESYLGEVENLDDFINKSQLLQGMLYKQIYEEIRWQKEKASMAINWNFCDSWPTYANNSLVEYGGKPKRALTDISNSLKPRVYSLITDSVKSSHIFSGKIGLLNDTLASHASVAEIIISQLDIKKTFSLPVSSCNDYQNSSLTDFSFDISDFQSGLFKLTLRGNDYDNEYYFIKS